LGKYLPNFKIGSYDYSHAPEHVRAFLCRIMAFIQTRKVMSKKERGEWYLANEKAFKKLVKQALKCYLLNLKPDFDSDELREFAKYALQKLRCLLPSGSYLMT
jgi:hypothetical protein